MPFFQRPDYGLDRLRRDVSAHRYANAMVAIEAGGSNGISYGQRPDVRPFSQPTARVLFSRVAVIVPNRVPTLMFRTANQRRNQILEAQMRVRLTAMKSLPKGIHAPGLRSQTGAQPESYSHSLGRRCIRLTSTVPLWSHARNPCCGGNCTHNYADWDRRDCFQTLMPVTSIPRTRFCGTCVLRIS